MTTNSVGFIVNPIAGMGGPVGLKGTDSREVLRRARALGAEPRSPDRADVVLAAMSERRGSFELLTGPGPMGETLARERGFSPTVIGEVAGAEPTSMDTRRVASAMRDADVDVIVFAGGDGTARDVHAAVGTDVPVIGIPAGVKIYSAVFCTTPAAAAELLACFIDGDADDLATREVMDIDETAFRDDRLSASLHGYLRVPRKRRLVQSPKSGSPPNEDRAKEPIGRFVAEEMDPETCYVIGPGTTTAAVMEALDVDPTLLGVDLVRDGELIAADVREGELLEHVSDGPARIIVGVIGGQGFVFGRGNQQISASVLRAVGTENVTVVATEAKIRELDGGLRVDTGDTGIDAELTGYTRVVTGYGTRSVVRIER